MNRKSVISITIAVICALFAVMLVNRYLSQKEDQLYEGMTLVDVVIVKEKIEAGTILKEKMLGKRQIPEKYLHEQAVDGKLIKSVIGEKVKYTVNAGEPLLWTYFGDEYEKDIYKGLSRRIPEGQRALSIPVDQISGVSGYLEPNDHVDILCTIRDQKEGEDVTLTLLQNLTILETGANIGSTARRGGYSTITLLVTIKEAEMLIFAQERGKLMALLRNPDDINTELSIPEVKYADIRGPEYRNELQKNRNKIEIIKRGQTVNEKKNK